MMSLNAEAVAALRHEPVEVRFKGLPAGWTGRTPAQICAERPDLFAAGPLGPVCVLDRSALEHNLAVLAAERARRAAGLEPTSLADDTVAMDEASRSRLIPLWPIAIAAAGAAATCGWMLQREIRRRAAA